MSARHTRSGAIANQLHDGTLFLPNVEPCWFQSSRPPGAHRRLIRDTGAHAAPPPACTCEIPRRIEGQDPRRCSCCWGFTS